MAVEYAFALPIFVAIVLGVVELGRVLFAVHVLHSATAEGARYAIVHGTESSAPATPAMIAAVVRNGAVIDRSRLQVEVREVAADGSTSAVAADRLFDRGETIRIVADYEFEFIFPILSLDTIDLRQFADMVVMH